MLEAEHGVGSQGEAAADGPVVEGLSPAVDRHGVVRPEVERAHQLLPPHPARVVCGVSVWRKCRAASRPPSAPMEWLWCWRQRSTAQVHQNMSDQGSMHGGHETGKQRSHNPVRLCGDGALAAWSSCGAGEHRAWVRGDTERRVGANCMVKGRTRLAPGKLA